MEGRRLRAMLLLPDNRHEPAAMVHMHIDTPAAVNPRLGAADPEIVAHDWIGPIPLIPGETLSGPDVEAADLRGCRLI